MGSILDLVLTNYDNFISNVSEDSQYDVPLLTDHFLVSLKFAFLKQILVIVIPH